MEQWRNHTVFFVVAASLGPAVVLARLDQIDFIAAATLKAARTMLGGEQAAVAGLPGKALGIPMAVGVNVRVGEWVVFWNASVGIQAQDLAVQRFEILCVTGRLRITHSPIELAVGTEFDSATVMIVGADNIVNKDFVCLLYTSDAADERSSV